MSTKAIAAISGIIGFAIGCTMMALALPKKHRTAETKMITSGTTAAAISATSTQAQAEIADAVTAPDAQDQAAFNDAMARRALDEVVRRRLANVYMRFLGSDGKLTPEFLELFGVTPDEASRLNQILQSAKTSMVNQLRSQAQVSRTEDGDIVVRFPPITAGPDIYDKVMGGFQTILGNDRFKDVMALNNNQIESQFNQFGDQVRTITIQKSGTGTITNANGEQLYEFKNATENGWTGGRESIKGLIKFYPELDGLISDD